LIIHAYFLPSLVFCVNGAPVDEVVSVELFQLVKTELQTQQAPTHQRPPSHMWVRAHALGRFLSDE
jgi:hypothetical protein